MGEEKGGSCCSLGQRMIRWVRIRRCMGVEMLEWCRGWNERWMWEVRETVFERRKGTVYVSAISEGDWQGARSCVITILGYMFSLEWWATGRSTRITRRERMHKWGCFVWLTFWVWVLQYSKKGWGEGRLIVVGATREETIDLRSGWWSAFYTHEPRIAFLLNSYRIEWIETAKTKKRVWWRNRCINAHTHRGSQIALYYGQYEMRWDWGAIVYLLILRVLCSTRG